MKHFEVLVETGKALDLVCSTIARQATAQRGQRQMLCDLREHQFAKVHQCLLRVSSSQDRKSVSRSSNRDQEKIMSYPFQINQLQCLKCSTSGQQGIATSSEENHSKEGQSDAATASSCKRSSVPKARVFVRARFLKPEMRLWIRRAARVGHLAVGSVYIVLGVVAFAATLDAGVRAVGFQGALRRVLESHAGASFLMAIGLGLVADGVWQGLRAAFNTDRADPGLRGYLERGSWVASGLIHLGLGIVAIKLAVGIGQKPSESQLKRWTQFIIPMQFGDWLVAGVGIVAIIVGIIFVSRAVRGEIDRWLDLSPLIRPLRVLVIGLGRFGVAARGAVFTVGGVLLVLAAEHVNPQEAHGLGGTLRTIESQQYGHLLLACVALGFIAYGIFELTCARYRRIRIPPDEG